MDLKEYYNKIVDEIKSRNFKILELTDHAPEKISPHIEAINYIIYDWNRDHKDDRDLEFEYVIQPTTDINFNDVSFDDFFNFLTKTKTNENILIETKDIEIIKIEKIKKEPEVIEQKEEIDEYWLKDDKPIQTKPIQPIVVQQVKQEDIDDFLNAFK